MQKHVFFGMLWSFTALVVLATLIVRLETDVENIFVMYVAVLLLGLALVWLSYPRDGTFWRQRGAAYIGIVESTSYALLIGVELKVRSPADTESKVLVFALLLGAALALKVWYYSRPPSRPAPRPACSCQS